MVRICLKGLFNEIEKIDRLLDLNYMTNDLLLPALAYVLDRKYITPREFEILRSVVKNEDMILKSADLNSVIGQESPPQRSRILKGLREKDMLFAPFKENGRLYTIGFANNYLLRGIIHILQEKNFIPEFLSKSK